MQDRTKDKGKKMKERSKIMQGKAIKA